MSGLWNDSQLLVLTFEPSQSFAIHRDDRAVLAANDEQCWRTDQIERVSSKIGPATAGNDSGNNSGQLGSCNERRSGPGTGSKVTYLQVSRARIVRNPASCSNKPVCKERNVKTKLSRVLI